MLSGPLRDRFQIREHLGYYSVGELIQILERNSKKLKVELDAEAALEIAKRREGHRGSPTIAFFGSEILLPAKRMVA